MKDDDLLQEVCKINAVQQIKASVESTLKCTAIVGVSTFVGGLLGGRIGLTLGNNYLRYLQDLKFSCYQLFKSYLTILVQSVPCKTCLL